MTILAAIGILVLIVVVAMILAAIGVSLAFAGHEIIGFGIVGLTIAGVTAFILWAVITAMSAVT